MWAQYADNHEGMCLVFDLKSFEDKIRTVYSESDVLHNKVDYQNGYNYCENNPFSFNLDKFNKEKYADIINHIKANYRDLLFKKLEDWQAEQEYRFTIFDKDKEYVKISFGDSLKGIVIGDRMWHGYINCLKEVCKPHDIQIRRITWKNFGVYTSEIYKKLG